MDEGRRRRTHYALKNAFHVRAPKQCTYCGETNHNEERCIRKLINKKGKQQPQQAFATQQGKQQRVKEGNTTIVTTLAYQRYQESNPPLLPQQPILTLYDEKWKQQQRPSSYSKANNSEFIKVGNSSTTSGKAGDSSTTKS